LINPLATKKQLPIVKTVIKRTWFRNEFISRSWLQVLPEMDAPCPCTQKTPRGIEYAQKGTDCTTSRYAWTSRLYCSVRTPHQIRPDKRSPSQIPG